MQSNFRPLTLIMLILIGSISLPLRAAINESSPSASTSTLSLPNALKNRKYEEDLSITDAKLKADAGSLSRYSAKFSLAYYGPTIDDLSKQNTPNSENAYGYDPTKVTGSIGVRYRIDSQSSISTGTGISAITPLHGIQRGETSNPYLSYDQSSKIADIQMRNSFGLSLITLPYYREQGEFGGANYDIATVYNLGQSKWSATLDSGISFYFFNREFDPKRKVDSKASRYNISIYPGLKYRFSDKLAFTTSASVGYWNPRRTGDTTSLQNKVVTQRFGLGWAVRRDIYVSPYVNVLLNRVALDTTSINISTVFSLL